VDREARLIGPTRNRVNGRVTLMQNASP
jgi:hypothetical protein